MRFYVKIVFALMQMAVGVSSFMMKEKYGVNHTLQTLINAEGLTDCIEEQNGVNSLYLACNYKFDEPKFTDFTCVNIGEGYMCM
tara:strand:- start:975 stop:1226 length:252 start_codon:yes stop_codon:yes gene_type:complete